MSKFIVLTSSNGRIVADSTGEVQKDKSVWTDEPANMPKLLDIDEWHRTYPNEDPFEYEWDILDWSFWTFGGRYAQRVIKPTHGDIN